MFSPCSNNNDLALILTQSQNDSDFVQINNFNSDATADESKEKIACEGKGKENLQENERDELQLKKLVQRKKNKQITPTRLSDVVSFQVGPLMSKHSRVMSFTNSNRRRSTSQKAEARGSSKFSSRKQSQIIQKNDQDVDPTPAATVSKCCFTTNASTQTLDFGYSIPKHTQLDVVEPVNIDLFTPIKKNYEQLAQTYQDQLHELYEDLQKIKKDALFYQAEFKQCKNELLESKKQNYEQRFKIEALKKRQSEKHQEQLQAVEGLEFKLQTLKEKQQTEINSLGSEVRSKVQQVEQLLEYVYCEEQIGCFIQIKKTLQQLVELFPTLQKQNCDGESKPPNLQLLNSIKSPTSFQFRQEFSGSLSPTSFDAPSQLSHFEQKMSEMQLDLQSYKNQSSLILQDNQQLKIHNNQLQHQLAQMAQIQEKLKEFDSLPTQLESLQNQMKQFGKENSIAEYAAARSDSHKNNSPQHKSQPSSSFQWMKHIDLSQTNSHKNSPALTRYYPKAANQIQPFYF